jgi:hypothetical protein
MNILNALEEDPQTNATINLLGEEEWKRRDDAGIEVVRRADESAAEVMVPE